MTEVDLKGLRRRDAMVLAGVVQRDRDRETRPPRPPTTLWKRLWAVARWQLPLRLRRLERRGLIEPDWRVNPFRPSSFRARATPLGARTARAALVTLLLEVGVTDFGD